MLYLTNMQAQLCKAETVMKMMLAFEVKKASLVINLMEGKGKYDAQQPQLAHPHETSLRARCFLVASD